MTFPENYGDYNCFPPFTNTRGCPPPPANGCNGQTDASCTFYNIWNQYPSRLLCTNLPNGTPLNRVLEALDAKICSTVAPNYASFNLYCLGQKYYISTAQQFAESISKELCIAEASITSLSTTLSAEITALEYPQVTDPLVTQDSTCACGCEPTQVPCIGILPTDSLQTVLNKMIAKICSCCAITQPTLPSLTATNSNTIQFVTSGPNNFNITANAIVSGASGNILTALSSGLYVPTPPAQIFQTLAYNPTTNVLTLSNGGGSVTLSTPAPQTLSIDCSGQTISISNGNTISLTCLLQAIQVTQTPINPVNTSSINISATGTANTTISANLNLDNTQPNAAIIDSSGLYVPLQVPITVNNTSTITWSQSGSFGTNLTASAKIDSTQPNALIVTAGGLYVQPGPQLVSTNTNTIQTIVSGNIIGANAIISPQSGNVLQATSQGLYVPAASGNAYTANNALTQIGSNFQWGGQLIQNTTVDHANQWQVNWINTPLINIGANNSLVGVNTVNIVDNNTTNAVQEVLTVSGTRLLDNTHTTYSMSDSFFTVESPAFTTTAPNIALTGLSGQIYFKPTGNLALTSDTNSYYSGIYGAAIAPGNFNITGTTISAGIFRLSAVGTGNISQAAAIKITGVGSTPLSLGSAYSGTITDYYGLRIEDFSLAPNAGHVTNSYAIYQAGAGDTSIFFGPVQNASAVTQFTSDQRVKQNIEPFVRGLSEINKINAKTYQYTYNKKRTVTGIIAQELEQIIPEAVAQGNFKTPDGTEYTDFRMIDQNVIFHTMLNAIKELSSQVDTLTAQVTALQNQSKTSS
jgi:hypothetical protein